MKKVIHVNRHRIASNAKTGERNPVITVKTYKSNEYAHEVIIRGKDGAEVARIVYRPDAPLSCGAKVWIEVMAGDVELVNLPAADKKKSKCTKSCRQ